MSPRTTSSSGDDSTAEVEAPSDAELPETDFEKAQAEEVAQAEAEAAEAG